MPTPTRSPAVPASLLFAALVGPLSAQSVVAPTDLAAEPVQLSPFVINAEADSGYAPNETLSGTRLRTQTRDVAAAMTIVTAEFMRDIGALNFNDVLDFIPSTAAYGTNETDQFSNGQRTGTPFIVRGARSDSLQTNFFTSFTSIDAYNTSRLTFNRGPNSILFGIGSVGGSLGVETHKADLHRNFGRTELRVDSFDSFRASVDASHVLVPGRAAVRLDLLHDDRGSNLQPSRNERDSAFATVTLRPTARATVYVDAETNRIRQKIPRPIAPFDWYTTWADAGRPLVARAATTTPVAGVEFQVGNGFPVFVPGVGALDWSRMALGARPLARGAREGSISFGSGSRYLIVPLDTYVVGDGDRVEYDTHNLSVLVQQQLAKDLFLEIGGRYDRLYRENFESPATENLAIKVDANAQLPNGAPNPNAGLPYTEQNPLWTKIATQIVQWRATLSYEKNLSGVRVFGRGLGRFSIAGLYENAANHQYLDNWRQVNETPLPISTTDLSNSRNMIRRRTYLVPGVSYFRSDFALFDQNGIRAGWEPVNTPRDNITRTQSYVLAGQANLLDNLLAVTGGWRRDEATVLQSNFTRDARGLFTSGSHGGTRAPAEEGVGRPYLYGIVLHAHRYVSLFYNRSTNYRAVNQSDRTISDRFLPPVTGLGFDTGVKLFAFGDRLTGSCTYFESEQRDVRDSSLSGSKAGWINSIWDAIDASRRPPSGWTDVKDQMTRGVEIQLVANVTKNLRVLANASRNSSVLNDHGSATFAYLAANYPLWEARAAAPVSSADGSTVGQLLARIRQEESDDRRVIGIRQTRVFEWQANVVGRYQFDRASCLRGFATGAAYRWRNAPVIGFYRIGNVLDPTRPYRGTGSDNLDLWLDYDRALSWRGHKYAWSVQLRVQNVWDDRSVQPWTAEDDGTGRMYIQQRRAPGARQWVLSTSLGF